MASASEQNDREEIRALVRKINEAWLAGRSDVLNQSFADDVVVRGPGFEVLGRGREACVKSYEDFIRQATVSEFKTLDPAIDLWGSTAVATSSWEIAYQMNGRDYHEFGHDLFVFAREDGRWWVVWRAVLPAQQPKS